MFRPQGFQAIALAHFPFLGCTATREGGAGAETANQIQFCIRFTVSAPAPSALVAVQPKKGIWAGAIAWKPYGLDPTSRCPFYKIFCVALVSSLYISPSPLFSYPSLTFPSLLISLCPSPSVSTIEVQPQAPSHIFRPHYKLFYSKLCTYTLHYYVGNIPHQIFILIVHNLIEQFVTWRLEKGARKLLRPKIQSLWK